MKITLCVCVCQSLFLLKSVSSFALSPVVGDFSLGMHAFILLYYESIRQQPGFKMNVLCFFVCVQTVETYCGHMVSTECEKII